MSVDGITLEVAPRPAFAIALTTDFVGSLMSISKSTRALTALLLNEIGLHAGQDQLLAALNMKKSISVCDVSSVLNVRPSTVSKMVDRLVVRGYIERGADKGDARRTVLRLTAEGESKRQEIHAIWRRLEDSLSRSDGTICDAEIATALHTMDSMLRKRLARLR